MKPDETRNPVQAPHRRTGRPNPAVVYRDALSRGSYWGAHHSLTTIARLLTGEDTDPWTFPPWELRYRDTAAVRVQLKARYAPATVNRMLSALRGVLKHAWRLGYLDAETYSRAADVENVSANALPSGRSLERDELAALFTACAEDLIPAGRRDAAILAVLYGGGLRRGELCGLDRADYDPADRALIIRRGKGCRQRIVYLNPGAARHLEAWLEARGPEPGPLFGPVNRAGQVRLSRLRGETIGYILKRREDEAGVEAFTSHDMRRTFISKLLEAGVDVFTVQKLAGHADPMTTARYDRRGEARQVAASQLLAVPV